MRSFFKILAIVMLLFTIAGAGVVLYALETREIRTEVAEITVIPASELPEQFDAYADALGREIYSGRVFGEETMLNREDTYFMTASVQLTNQCLLPMEWIDIAIVPEAGDILEEKDDRPHVLSARSEGVLSIRILTTEPGPRTAIISYYLLGEKYTSECQLNFN